MLRSVWIRPKSFFIFLIASTPLFLLSCNSGENKPIGSKTITLYAAPNGGKSGSGCTSDQPCDLVQAKLLMRNLLAASKTAQSSKLSNDIIVYLQDGIYQLKQPLLFDAEDSPPDGNNVIWEAASGAHPMLSGAQTITGWTASARKTGVWEAPVSGISESRNLYINGKLVPVASSDDIQSQVSISKTGVQLPSSLPLPTHEAEQSRMELVSYRSWTNRISPVLSISAPNFAIMKEPAWANNTWGFEPIQTATELHLQNAFEFIQPGQWYFDPDAKKIYYWPKDGENMNTIDAELGRLETLLQIGGSYDRPAQNLTFSGLTFKGTTWLQPGTQFGYAAIQTGVFLYGASFPTPSGSIVSIPSDAYTRCAPGGCPEWEATRDSWRQPPGAVQISASHNITLDNNTYTNLGGLALGIGEDAPAHLSGVGLGAQNITIANSTFYECGGGGIMIGGVQPDAHHPSQAEMINSNIKINNNSFHDLARQYQDQDPILATYVSGLTISHNDIYRAPYSGIGVGYGWGIYDVGGRADYKARGTYNWRPVLETPTIASNYTINSNYVHDVMGRFIDGAGIYTLSTVPNSRIDRNYVISSQNGLYFDEASQQFTASENVVKANPFALLHQTRKITLHDNWGINNNYLRIANPYPNDGNNLENPKQYNDEVALPLAARQVVYSAGIAPAQRVAGDDRGGPVYLDITLDEGSLAVGETANLSVMLANLDSNADLSQINWSVSAPDGMQAVANEQLPTILTHGQQPQIFTWRITRAAAASSGPVTVLLSYQAYGQTQQVSRTLSLNAD